MILSNFPAFIIPKFPTSVHRDCWLTIFLIQTFLASGRWVEVVGGRVIFSDFILVNVF